MSSHVAVFPHCAPSLNMADRRSVQEFVQNVINLQTRSNQRGNKEESSRAEFESITDKVNAQFQDKVVKAEGPLHQLLLHCASYFFQSPAELYFSTDQKVS